RPGRSPAAGGSGRGEALPAILLLGLLALGVSVLLPSGKVLPLPSAAGFAARPHLTAELDGSPVRQVVIDSYLVHAAALPTWEPVLWLALEDSRGRRLAEWRMVSGRDTADWAAARPDVASRPGFVAPPPFLSRLAYDGRFFGQIYRAHFRTEEPVPARRLVLGRPGSLEQAVEIRITRLEVRR
ncbi:MAG: hypothetical protein MI919_22035, partial [Holophagales bacterium]|nr:hypothetical protein [Holophagales bacterium]